MTRLLVSLILVAACNGELSSSTTTASAQDGKSDGVQLPVQMALPPESWFVQDIDHPADGSPSPGTFQQRFWVSTQFAHGPNSPVLFHLCGEGPCDPIYAVLLADSAQALGAAVVVLEHRYYGQSAPFSELTFDNLRYLTIHNALEDAAAFERWAQLHLSLA